MLRIIAADDSTIPLGFIRNIARSGGHEVVATAANGKEAVALCAKHRPDVVILDITMPVMTGDAAARKIVEAGTARSVVIASSNSQNAIVQDLLALGCRFITKPYTPTALGKALQELDACR